jgi:hypothetical protein
MCGCGGGSGAWTTSAATSGAWNGTASRVDGPWEVQLPVYGVVDGRPRVSSFETVEVSTYSEADALVRQRDPATGKIRGGGIRRKLTAA